MKTEIDGLHVIEEFLLTKGEHVVNSERLIPFEGLLKERDEYITSLHKANSKI